MAKHRRNSRNDKVGPPGDAVARNMGGTYWSVDDCRWDSIRPTLPDDLTNLLAPPIVVGVSRVVGVAKPPPSAVVKPASSTPPAAKARNSGTTRPPGRHRRPNATG